MWGYKKKSTKVLSSKTFFENTSMHLNTINVMSSIAYDNLISSYMGTNWNLSL